jgi:uncharacterized radical SAM superfamily protein
MSRKQELQSEAQDILDLDQRINEKSEELKALKKARDEIVQRLVIGCSQLNQHTIFDSDEDQ